MNISDPLNRNFQSDAQKLLAQGWPAVRWCPGTKTPADKRWSVRALDKPDEYKLGEPPGLRLGISVGDWPRPIVVDLDLPKDDPIQTARFLEISDRLLPYTSVQDGRLSAPRTHRYYRLLDTTFPETTWPKGGAIRRAIDDGEIPPFPRAHRIKLVKGGGIDLLGLGSACACPPCPHPCGEIRRWNVNGMDMDTDTAPPVELCGAVEFRVLVDALDALVMELDQ